MSELKAYNVVATADVNPEVVDILGCTEWAGYDKDEVDAVLAEKDEEIARLKNEADVYKAKYEQEYDIAVHNEKQLSAMRIELRHADYKRCLAMRNMCRYAQYSYSYLMENESCKIRPNNIDFRKYNKKYHFYIRWRKRWLELADEFKEAK